MTAAARCWSRPRSPTPDGMLKPGYFAHVTMDLGHDRALFIPSLAVLRYADVARVSSSKMARCVRREVTTGSVVGDHIEIIAGLKDGRASRSQRRRSPGRRHRSDRKGAVVILADLCVRRPVFATMFVGVLVVLGWFSYMRLGVDLFPKVDMPTVMVTTFLPGAAPEETEARVTKPLEEVINTVSGIDELRSNTLGRRVAHHGRVQARSRHQRRRAGRARQDFDRARSAARRDQAADGADVRPGRGADPDLHHYRLPDP